MYSGLGDIQTHSTVSVIYLIILHFWVSYMNNLHEEWTALRTNSNELYFGRVEARLSIAAVDT